MQSFTLGITTLTLTAPDHCHVECSRLLSFGARGLRFRLQIANLSMQKNINGIFRKNARESGKMARNGVTKLYAHGVQFFREES